MDIGNFIFMTFLLAGTLLAYQRTIGKMRWLSLLLIVLPVTIFSYRWSLYKEQNTLFRNALIIAFALNVIFWLAYGRNHPPGHKGDIVVIGMDEE